MIHPKLLAILGCAVVAALVSSPDAQAQSYPSQPVKLVVPFPAGSATDNIARIIGRELQDDLGQPFVIDNRPGAQGMLGADFVAKSPPDGYTILVAAVSFAATGSMFRKVSFDPVADFTPVSRMATTPLALMVKIATDSRTRNGQTSQPRNRSHRLPHESGSAATEMPFNWALK